MLRELCFSNRLVLQRKANLSALTLKTQAAKLTSPIGEKRFRMNLNEVLVNTKYYKVTDHN